MPQSREYGPYWFSRFTRYLGLFCYPEKMSDWQKSGLVPAKFWQSMEFNQGLNTCCRDMGNMMGRVYRTNPRNPPDLFIATCSCGRNHYRVRLDPVNGQPTSIFDHPYDSGVVYE